MWTSILRAPVGLLHRGVHPGGRGQEGVLPAAVGLQQLAQGHGKGREQAPTD